mgnify:CR=1 FL=1
MPRKPKPTARDKIALALVYLDDGAPMSAARCLREAADTIEAAGKKFNAALEKAIGEGKPKP